MEQANRSHHNRASMNRQAGGSVDRMHQDLLRMGTLVEEALRKGLSALEMKDYDLADTVVAADRNIDQMQRAVEEQCTRLIADEQPTGARLREIVTAIKIASTLERLGDHARHLARRARSITDSHYIQTLPVIREMAEIGISMLHDFLTAWVEQSPDRAIAVAARDDQLDRLHAQLMRDIMRIVQARPDTIERGVDLLFVNRFLERLGDHVTNMCEWVVFVERAEYVELNQ
ncbi:MAG: phosphate transport system regulatory protein PhoU [Spirochaetaceae bacterium]|nr:MAG: phosphate transport system regulatory protein PhoU [Spirochaetaceae bacterium]